MKKILSVFMIVSLLITLASCGGKNTTATGTDATGTDASGGVSTLDDVRCLADMGLYGAIIGKAYYTGAVRLEEAVREAQ